VPELFRVTGKYQMMAFGLILVFSMLLMPQGIIGTWQRLRDRRGSRQPVAREAGG
jgi:ABC-type branched-subunit amino acid transport system permease subunit